ncbi:hypothetical protein M0805_008194 [Coniferiporia weirii]|nr:hypothetical protein M0805_008194 [Coniferiporia weirii]
MPAEILDAMPNGAQACDLSTAAQFSAVKASANGAALVQTLTTPPNAPPGPEDEDTKLAVAKKKKKKRVRKPAARSKAGDVHAVEDCASSLSPPARSPAVLCISRNKHWKYISSYHGPWLQLPLELLESLLILNLDPVTVSTDLRPPSSPDPAHGSMLAQFGITRLQEPSGPLINLGAGSPHAPHTRARVHSPSSATSTSYAQQPAVRAAPPPIDPGVFRSVAAIRRLIDEAAELAVRASSGLSAAALGARDTLGLGGGAWGTAQSLGLGGAMMGDFGYGFGGGGGGGRNAPMSATRVHRLRALAVQKLAEAYKADEIASSVMVMQRGTVFDDIAEKVLKVDPRNVDARYVHFFHEKIPSRQLAESTSTAVLDQLIAENPQRLEFYRTRGVVHCFRDEYVLAAKDFTFALKESRAVRRARQAHDPVLRPTGGENYPKAKRKSPKVNGQAPPSGTAAVIGEADGEPPQLLHPSLQPDAPAPLEPQVLFHRGAAHLAHAFFLIEEALFALEGIPRIPPNDFDEVHLAYITNGRYGGTEIGNPDGPLGAPDGTKARAYHAAFAQSGLREQVCALLRKSKRDHERFLAHFDIIGDEPNPDDTSDILQQIEHAFLLLETFRPHTRTPDTGTSTSTSTSAAGKQGAPLSDAPLPFSTYHPLLLEAHFSVLLCLLLLGDFGVLTHTFARAARAVAGLEGYPVFLPPRSMAQAEFGETLERLAGGWRCGKMPNALVRVTEPRQRPRMPTPSLHVQPNEHTAAVPSHSSSSAGPSMSTSGPSASGSGSPASDEDNPSSRPPDPGAEATAVRRAALEHLRLLLAPVHARLRTRAEGTRSTNGVGGHGHSANGGGGGERKPAPLNLALHGARVEVILAWLGAVQLPELEAVADL